MRVWLRAAVAIGLAGAISGSLVAVTYHFTRAQQDLSTLQPTATPEVPHPECRTVYVPVKNDFYFTDTIAVSKIMGVALCLLVRNPPVIVFSDDIGCNLQGVPGTLGKNHTMAVCDDGIKLQREGLESLRGKNPAVWWFTLSLLAANTKFGNSTALCAAAYITRYMWEKPGLLQTLVDGIEATPEEQPYINRGIALMEQGRDINYCIDFVPGTLTRWTPEVTPPAPAALQTCGRDVSPHNLGLFEPDCRHQLRPRGLFYCP